MRHRWLHHHRNSNKEIDKFVVSSKNGPDNFILADEGDLDKFLGNKITQINAQRLKLSQTFPNDRTVSFLRIIKKLKNDVKTPSSQTAKFLQHLLHKALEGKTSERNSERLNNIRPNSEVSTTQKPSHKKAIKQMPTPKTQKMYNHVHKLSHHLVQSSTNRNSLYYS